MIVMIKLPFRHSQKHKNFAVVEINSDCIRCMVFEPPQDAEGTFKVLGVSRIALDPGFVRAGLILDEDHVSTFLKSAVLDAGKDIENLSKEVILSIGGELSVCNITTVKVTRDGQIGIKKKEIDKIYKAISQASLENASTLFMESTGNIDIKMEAVISSDVYFKLDGVVVTDIEGKRGSELEIAVFSTFSPSFNITALEHVCKKAGVKLIGISPQLYGITLMLKRLKGQYFDGVVVNMGSDYTEVGVVFGGGLVATKTLSIGSEHFTAAIASKAGISQKEAKLKKTNYLLGKLESSEALEVQSMTSDLLELWLDGIQVLFEEFSGVKTFSSKIYLTGEEAKMPGLLDMISKEPWTKSIPFKSPPEYALVACEDYLFMQDLTDKCSGTEYAPLAGICDVYLFLAGMVN